MSTSKNKANVQRLIDEVYVKGKISLLDELFMPDYVYHYAGTDIKGPEGFKQNMDAYKKAFPDLHVKIDRLVAEDDMVAAFLTYGGTFKGELMGVAPTGKKVEISAVVLSRHGKGARQLEAWTYMDMLDWYRQLGIKPPG